ncbi:hypothetical protein A3726_26210 [Erythrobacter sp. HI0037]|nr:hypothetical protein A3719_11855 [Erythrobacter sp. HI0020]KZY18572.1 hypothetical protein A3727_03025 [Erythrobacter sp. HI0038]KZY21931.1 hypothetical protein A3726_16295 [Erythrobacter sp. HI0037]KZY25120.1 hypothetical protein A3726_26210 [Erythrobacter sp. HI0037]
MSLAGLSLFALVPLFLTGAVLVWFAGARLAGYADTISQRSGIGQATIGVILLGAVTSLPEITTTSVAVISDNPRMAVNNLVGGVAFQVVVIALADLFVGKDALTSMVPGPRVMLNAAVSRGRLCDPSLFGFVFRRAEIRRAFRPSLILLGNPQLHRPFVIDRPSPVLAVELRDFHLGEAQCFASDAEEPRQPTGDCLGIRLANPSSIHPLRIRFDAREKPDYLLGDAGHEFLELGCESIAFGDRRGLFGLRRLAGIALALVDQLFLQFIDRSRNCLHGSAVLLGIACSLVTIFFGQREVDAVSTGALVRIGKAFALRRRVRDQLLEGFNGDAISRPRRGDAFL